MSPTTLDKLEHIALDGPFGLSLAIALGIVVLALLTWALRRERGILGRQNTVLFWLLRTVALITVLWMLLAPMNVCVETSTTRRAVAIVTDISGSMQTVDPAGTSDDVRWIVADSAADKYAATRSADRAVAAMGMAQHHLQTVAEALKQHKPETFVVEATSAANAALNRVKDNLQQVEERSAPAGKSRSLAGRLVSSLAGPEFQDFAQLCLSLEKGRTPSQTGWRESLPDLEHRLAGLKRSLHELARNVAVEESQQVANQNPALLTSMQKLPRLGRAAQLVGRLQNSVLAGIQAKADVQLQAFDQTLSLVADSTLPEQSLKAFLTDGREVTGAALGTNVSSVLEELNRGRQNQPLAAVFLLSDMAHNANSDHNPREVAATLTETPVYVVPIGNTQYVRDVILQSAYAPAVAMRNDDIVIEATLQAHHCEGEVCVVQLLQDGEVIDFREVVIDSGFANRTIRFEQRMPSVGSQQFQVAIMPVEGELTEENNYDDFEVNVTRSDIKVLLADELPRWEYRYLAQLFRRDAKVECDEMLFHPRMIATGRREATMTFPITVDEWDQYDVVLLGDLPTEHLPVAAQESLIEYVRQRGGTLIMIAGAEAMPQAYVDHPLVDILPVQRNDNAAQDAGEFAFRVTNEGQDHHALMIGESQAATRLAWDFVNRFAPLPAISPWRQPVATARTLIAAVPRDSLDPTAAEKNNAFLCWQPIGRGRVVYLAGPDTYRLRFLRGDQLHYRFWGQLLRWAIAADLSAGTKFVRVRTTKPRYRTGEDIQVSVRLADADGEPVVAEDLLVRVTSGQDERSVPLSGNTDIPGEYQAEIRSLPPGVYRIEPTGSAIDDLQKNNQEEPASASFTVQAELPTELLDTRCDRALAQQIADVTGGQVLPPTAIEEILNLTNLDPIVTEKIETRPLWLEWKYLWLVFGCLQIEWAVRKWKGLS